MVSEELVRIYPAIIIVETIGLLFFNINTEIWGQYEVAARYFVCARFWFLQVLIFLYIPYYIVMATKLKDHFSFVLGVVAFIYFICYLFFVDKTIWIIESSRFKWIFYFEVMLIGGKYELQVKQQKKIINCKIASVTTVIMFMGFYGFKYISLKYILDKNPKIMPLQFIERVIHIIFMQTLMAMLLQYEYNLKIYGQKIWWKPIKRLSSITLEIYVVMHLVINRVETYLVSLSLLLAFGLIFALAGCCMHYLR